MASTIIDVAILTILPVENHAVLRALKINSQKDRIHSDGSLFFRRTVHSEVTEEDMSVLVGCVGEATQANAAAMTSIILKEYSPRLLILCGIAAGMRDKLRIGDIIVPREVADLSVHVATDSGMKPRPKVSARPHAVRQMLTAFQPDSKRLHAHCRDVFGPPIPAPADKKEDYDKHVSFEPKVADNALASEDVLWRASDTFAQLMRTHEGIRATEMEAGGFIKATEMGATPRPWLVVRGISDFGDSLKEDYFHNLAASAAAAWVLHFLESGLDLKLLASTVPQAPAPTPEPLPTQTSGFMPMQALLSSQIDLLSKELGSARSAEIDALRRACRKGQDEDALKELRAFKLRADWQILAPDVKAKVLRFEASLTLGIEENITLAKQLRATAADLEPAFNLEALDGRVAYQERGAEAALTWVARPQTLEGWNLRLALLGELGRWPEVWTEAQIPPSGTAPDAETHRIRALAQLAAGKVDEARAEISQAKRLEPEWFSVRFAEAIVDYHAGLSPAVIPHLSVLWPGPVDVGLVRIDRSSLERVRRAETIFTDLMDTTVGKKGAVKESLEGWKLACLGNQPTRREDAQRYLAEILAHNPTHQVALLWASARGLTFDAEAVISQLAGAEPSQ